MNILLKNKTLLFLLLSSMIGAVFSEKETISTPYNDILELSESILDQRVNSIEIRVLQSGVGITQIILESGDNVDDERIKVIEDKINEGASRAMPPSV